MQLLLLPRNDSHCYIFRIARRTTIEDINAWLVSLGASDDEAATITELLGSAGLTPARMRRWLKPGQSYSIFDGWLAEDVPWNQAAEFLVEDGKTWKVIAAAEEFASASDDERYISESIAGGNLDQHVRPLTRGDEARAARVRRVVELLLAQLRTPTRVHSCLQTTFGPGDSPEEMVRLVDCLLDDRLEAVLSSLEDGSFDAWHHMEVGQFHGYGW